MDVLKKLPVFQEFEKFKQQWATNSHVILKSPTGSGKSIALPYLLATTGLVKGKILVVQPRRIAARLLATQVARIAQWSLGKEVGYHVRFDKRFSSKTQIIYVTEGIAQNMLLDQEALNDVEVLILDEFHERSAQIDLSLALALRLWNAKRRDLRIIVTSATLDIKELVDFLPDSGSLELMDRSYPVQVEHRAISKEVPIWKNVVDLLPGLLKQQEGDILIFMDGAYEISKTIRVILENSWSSGLEVSALYGDLSPEKQDMALRPSVQRKIIVSTNIAETSLTIEGIKIVIDTGKAKKLSYDRNRGVNALISEPISKSAADQRAGRAGRLGPGYCLRLWTASEHQKRPEFDPPEIFRIDLSQIYLNLLGFGLFLEQIKFFEPVSASHISEAKEELKKLGAINSLGVLTDRGKRMCHLPIHPIWGNALLVARDKGFSSAIALLLAMLDERPPVQPESLGDFFPMRNPRSDPYCLLLAFEEAIRKNFSVQECRQLGIHSGRCKDSEKVARSLCSLIDEDYNLKIPAYAELAQVLLSCFPNSIARQISSARNIYEDAHGRRLHLSKRSLLKNEEFVLPLRVVERRVRGLMVLEMEWSTGLDKAWVEEFLGSQLTVTQEVYLDLKSRKVVKREVEAWRQLILSTRESEDVGVEERAKAYATALLKGELKLKNWNAQVEKLLARQRFLSTQFPELGINEFDEELKFIFLEQLCQSASTWKELRNAEVFVPLLQTLSKEQRSILDEAVPENIDLGVGRKPYSLDYSKDDEVIIGVTLQDLYEVKIHPSIVFGKYPLVVEILAPNRRPVQRTTNLPSFWTGAYPEIKKELAGRYPKHEWR